MIRENRNGAPFVTPLRTLDLSSTGDSKRQSSPGSAGRVNSRLSSNRNPKTPLKTTKVPVTTKKATITLDMKPKPTPVAVKVEPI